MQAIIDEYLDIDTMAILSRRLIGSYVRTAICLAGLGLMAVLFYEAVAHRDAGPAVIAMFVAIFTLATLLGYTPRVLRRFGTYWPTSTIHDTATKKARVAAAKHAIRTGVNLGIEAFRMRRRLKILLISRLLGAVTMAIIWVASTWYSQHTLRTAHFERFGTYEGVHVVVHLDGTETVTIDPSLSPGSVRQTMEQPPRPLPVVPAAQPRPAAAPTESAAEPAPALEADPTPIVPPNPPLPSFWPPITPGYSVKVYDRTSSGALRIVEVRVHYADGKTYAVGP